MINLIRSKIEALAYKDPTSCKELKKMAGVCQFAVLKKANTYSPPHEGFLLTIQELKSFIVKEEKLQDESAFNFLKKELLSIIDNFRTFCKANDIEEISDFDRVFSNEKRRTQEDELSFALLMVEQNNLEYFKNKPPHFSDEPHERFYSHYIIHTSGNQSTFIILDTSDLPQYIKDEALLSVKETSERYGKMPLNT